MSLSKSISIGNQYDASGNPIVASYWKITSLTANVIAQTFTLTYSGYDGSAGFNANPAQTPLATVQVNYPDAVDAPGYPWPFSPTYLAANFASSGVEAFLASAEAYAMQMPYFSGATQVS